MTWWRETEFEMYVMETTDLVKHINITKTLLFIYITKV